MKKLILSILVSSFLFTLSCKVDEQIDMEDSIDTACSEDDLIRLIQNWVGSTYNPGYNFCSMHYCAEMELNFNEDFTYMMHYRVFPPGSNEVEREFMDTGTYKAVCISSYVHIWAGRYIEWDIEFTSDFIDPYTERIEFRDYEGGLIIDDEILDIDDSTFLVLIQ